MILGLIFSLTIGGITLAWDPDSESDLQGYNVDRSEEGAEFVKLNLDLVTEPIFTDEAVDMRTTYRYYVTAVNPAGESDPSEEVEVNILQHRIGKIVGDVSELQAGTRDLRDQADAIRLAVEELEDQLGNDPELITRRYIAGNAVRQYEILLSHLNALVRLLLETK